MFIERAPKFNVGLIFEPAFPDGSLVNERKGSVNYTVIARGKAAHAGRDYYAGRNAIIAMARFAQGIETLNDRQEALRSTSALLKAAGPQTLFPTWPFAK